MLFVVVLINLAIVLLLLIGMVVIFFRAFRRIWRWTQPNQILLRGLILAAGLGLIISPVFAFKVWEHDSLLGRVPDPLAVASIEYRLEESWGVGFMPADNETGFVVYQLTEESADWARQQGSGLGNMLEAVQGEWNPTPVDDSSNDRDVRRWHPYDYDPQMMSEIRPASHPPSIGEYLEKYGFTIPIEPGKDNEANRSLWWLGSFYAYGKGGSVRSLIQQEVKSISPTLANRERAMSCSPPLC